MIFPQQREAYRPRKMARRMRSSPSLTPVVALVYATTLGGSQAETGAGIAVDNSGSAYLVGSTDSADLLSIRSTTGIQATRIGNPLYKSVNQAGNWANSSNGIKAASVNVLAIDPKTSTT